MLTFLAWLLEPGLVAPWSLAAISLVPAFALAFAVLSWPSRDEAARVADHRLRLDERLGTAVELVSASRAGAKSLCQYCSGSTNRTARWPPGPLGSGPCFWTT